MSLEEALNEIGEEASRKGAEQMRSQAIEILRETGSRLDYDVGPVIQSFTEVRQRGDGSFGFEVTHPASVLFEFGSEPHTIEPSDPDGVLAFEQNGETVFAKKVDHPGTEAILFVSKSEQQLDARGLSDQYARR